MTTFVTSNGFGYFLAAVALIAGILILTGNGDFLLKGGNSSARDKLYDKKKMEKVSGIAMLLIGVLSIIDTFMTSVAFKVVYIILMIAIIFGMGFIIQKYCKK